MRSQSQRKGPFPIEHAFVVQFNADTSLDAESMTGRIEHLLTGQNARFESLETLQAFVVRVLKSDAPLDDNDR